MNKLQVYWEFARPFTLLMPAVGMAAGGIVAWGADPRFQTDWGNPGAGVWLRIGLGAIMAAIMNAGSNGLNQIYDLEIDRINKPARPLPSGRLRLRQAWGFTGLTLSVGLALAWLVNWQCLAMALAAAILTACYSVPPARTKRWGPLASLTVALPRGFLLPVAGWSAVKSVATAEPWLLSLPLGLFILGASSTKDFSDIPGTGQAAAIPFRSGTGSGKRP